MLYKLLIAGLLFSNFVSAQDCSKEELAKKPGTWKMGMKGQIVNVIAADLVKERSVTTAIHKMVSANYKPTGCQITYSTVFGKNVFSGEKYVADPYYYSMYILRYLCDEGNKDKTKYYVDYSTPTTVNITANVIYSLNTLYATNLSDEDPRGYFKLKQRPVLKDGYYFLGEEVVGDSYQENKIKEYRWLITYNDTLPFSYVSRKEYLMIQRKRLEKDVKDSPSDKQYLDQYVKKINDYLSGSESELSKPAICMWNEEERFEKFVDEGTRGSFIAVRPNMAYFRKKLPLSSPQYFTVIFKIAHGDPVFEENIANIKKAIDFAALKNMLGK